MHVSREAMSNRNVGEIACRNGGGITGWTAGKHDGNRGGELPDAAIYNFRVCIIRNLFYVLK